MNLSEEYRKGFLGLDVSMHYIVYLLNMKIVLLLLLLLPLLQADQAPLYSPIITSGLTF